MGTADGRCAQRMRGRGSLTVCSAALGLCLALPLCVLAQAGVTIRASVATGGGQASGDSWWPSISGDGRYVVFHSVAPNLVPADTNGVADVFLHDRVTGQTTRMSVATGGGEAENQSLYPSISADGRYVAFESLASNLVPGDTNLCPDVFVHDRVTGQTTRVSVATGGAEGNEVSGNPAITADGRYVAFESLASNLVPGDTKLCSDVFVHDRVTGQTTRVSVATGGEEAEGGSDTPFISPDGSYVAFTSHASNLVPGDTNGCQDIYVHDRFREPGDLDSDGAVDAMDLRRFIMAWREFTAGESDWDRAADLHYDGKLTVQDADLMVEAFLRASSQ